MPITIPFPSILKSVIDEYVVTPLFTRQSTPAWDDVVRSRIISRSFNRYTKAYHRNIILQRGQADFARGTAGLNTYELAILYSYYYFQMHFSSSVALYYHQRNLLRDVFSQSRNIVFIDIGCGPYTSGLSFLHFTRLQSTRKQLNPFKQNLRLEYHGIDNSDGMLALGNTLLAMYQKTINDGGYRFLITAQDADYNNIPIQIGSRDSQTTIILNCCYFFASQSINVTDFTNAIQTLINNNPSSKIILFYQNAFTNYVHIGRNYLNFRKAIQGLSQNRTNIETLQFSFVDEFNSTMYESFTGKVKFQVLKNY